MLRIPNKGRKSYQPSAISCQPEVALFKRRKAAANGFTLIEMVVVVAIIGLLLAISIPVSTGVLNSQRARATESMLETVKNAIEVYQSDRPLKFHSFVFEQGSYWDLFGPLPPSPTAALTLKYPSPDPDLVISAPEMDAKTGLVSANAAGGRTVNKLIGVNGLIEVYLRGVYTYDSRTYPKAPNTYPTTECLLACLRRFSPQSRAILERIGKYITNEDKDAVSLINPVTGNPYVPAKLEDLFELRDSWGNAVRYTVRYIGPVVGGYMYRWELRSAGPDGQFADVDVNGDGVPDPFAVEAERYPGDDVVVSGSIKVEPN